MEPDRQLLNRIGQKGYEAFHAADCSPAWNDLGDDRHWYWREVARAMIQEILTIDHEHLNQGGLPTEIGTRVRRVTSPGPMRRKNATG